MKKFKQYLLLRPWAVKIPGLKLKLTVCGKVKVPILVVERKGLDSEADPGL